MSAPDAQLRARFEALTADWQRHLERTAHLSFPYAAIDCEAFPALVALGDAILPLVFARYVDLEVPWAALLSRLHPEVEAGDGLVGDVAQARVAWLAWARRQGLLAR